MAGEVHERLALIREVEIMDMNLTNSNADKHVCKRKRLHISECFQIF